MYPAGVALKAKSQSQSMYSFVLVPLEDVLRSKSMLVHFWDYGPQSE